MIPPKPVTLATLESAATQEVFDWVAFNLLQQNKRSENCRGMCMYRGENDTKCAAGWLIDDDNYNASMEGMTWLRLVDKHIAPACHSGLIAHLQGIHDATLPDDWKTELYYTAKTYALNTEVLDSLK